MKCSSCLTLVPLSTILTAKFCLNCGAKLEPTQSSIFRPKLTSIERGKFWMGAPFESNEESAKPQRYRIIEREFYIGAYPVTHSEYAQVMNLTIDPQMAKLPIVNISYYDVICFCDILTRKSGNQYRLPSEAEWEYACGSQQLTDFNCNSHRIMPVGSYAPNSNGLYDMQGNVWEWCLDGWVDNYYKSPKDSSPRLGTTERVIRGGSFREPAERCRSISRDRLLATSSRDDVGFRLVMEA